MGPKKWSLSFSQKSFTCQKMYCLHSGLYFQIQFPQPPLSSLIHFPSLWSAWSISSLTTEMVLLQPHTAQHHSVQWEVIISHVLCMTLLQWWTGGRFDSYFEKRRTLGCCWHVSWSHPKLLLCIKCLSLYKGKLDRYTFIIYYFILPPHSCPS